MLKNLSSQHYRKSQELSGIMGLLSFYFLFLIKNGDSLRLEGFCHIEVEQILFIHHITADVEADVHTGLHFDT